MSANTGNPWTAEDLAFLIASFPTMGRAWTAKKLNRSVPAIDCKAKSLGLRAPGPGWRDGVPGLSARIRETVTEAGSVGASMEDIVAATPETKSTSRNTVVYHMVKGGQLFAYGPRGSRRIFAVKADGERWDRDGRPLTTREQAEAAREVAREARREQIKAQRVADGLLPIIRGDLPKQWTDEETAKLREHYPTLGAVRTARLLDRTWRAVRGRAQKLGIRCETNVKALNAAENKQAERAEVLKRETSAAVVESRGRLAKHDKATKPGVAPGVSVAKRGPFDESIPVTYHPNFKFTSKAAPPQPLRTNTHSVF